MSDELKMWPIRVGMKVTAAQEAVRRGLINHPQAAVFTVSHLPSHQPSWFLDENGDEHYIAYYVEAASLIEGTAEAQKPALPDALRDFGPEPPAPAIPRREGTITQNKPSEADIAAVVEQVVEARGKTHGDWGKMADVAQTLKATLHQAPNWGRLSLMQRETLDSVCTKIARIVVGDASVREHWVDLIGYLEITLHRMEP